MHSQAVDFTSTKLVLEPSTKLMFGASMAVADASECVTVHSLDPDVSITLLCCRWCFSGYMIVGGRPHWQGITTLACMCV